MGRQDPSARVTHRIEARDGDPIVPNPKLSTGRRGVAAVAFVHAHQSTCADECGRAHSEQRYDDMCDDCYDELCDGAA